VKSLAFCVPLLLGCTGMLPTDAATELAGEWFGVVPCGSDAALTVEWDLSYGGEGDLDGSGSLHAERGEGGVAFYALYGLDVDVEGSGAQELDATATVTSCEGNDSTGDGRSCEPLAPGSALFVTGEFTWDGQDAIEVDVEAENIGNIVWECHGGMERD